MMKNFKMLTMFAGILMFMLIGLGSVQASGLNWDTTDFAYDASVGGDSFSAPMDYSPGVNGIGTYSSLYTPPDPITSTVNIQVTPGSANAALSASAWGGTIEGGASAGAFVSYDLTNLAADEALTYGGEASSWVKRKVTVNSNGLYNLHGNFTGTIDFNGFYTDSTYHATSSYTGAVKLEEFVIIPGTGLMNLSTWELSIDDMIGGLNVLENIQIRSADDDSNPIHYYLTVGFSGLEVNVSNLMMPFQNRGPFPENIYELGNASNPLLIDGYLTSNVPVPGSLLLLFSGLAGLFGFNLSLRRRGSSNSL